MPISAPNSDEKAEVARAIAEQVLNAIPIIGAPVNALVRLAFPPGAVIREENWRREITAVVNDLNERIEAIRPTILLSEDALCLARWLDRHSTDGWADIFGPDNLQEAFPFSSIQEILAALGELAAYDMVEIAYSMNSTFSHVTLTNTLYETFDPMEFPGWNARRDASEIASLLVEGVQGFSAPDFEVTTKWPKRRINPALQIVADFIGNGRKSAHSGTGFCFTWLHADPREKALLKRHLILEKT